ncbi:MAG TPA: C4-dicarboxylate ABC transporter, partial [Pseudomonas sp.]|nr:C4-dicarboxylate ABC transporter [Pseudomonas sp.]
MPAKRTNRQKQEGTSMLSNKLKALACALSFTVAGLV